MLSVQPETVAHSPLPQPPPFYSDFYNLYKPTNLSFKRPKTMHLSLPNNNTHLSLLDKPIDSGAYSSILESCRCPNLGKQIHAHALKTGFHGHQFLETKLLQMYGRSGCLEDAVLLFEKMPLRNSYSWTAILNVHVGHGLFEEAFLLFQQLLFGDIELEFFVFPVVLKICSGFGALELGRQLHGIVIKYQFASNIYVSNALIDMYGKCGSLNDAKKVLTLMPERDRVSWNSVITAYSANGMVFKAFEFLEKMSNSDHSTPNLVSWNAVISGFAQNGYDKEAIELLFRIQEAGLKPNVRTLASVLPACARSQMLTLGREIHGYITRHGFTSNPFVVNGLVDMYRRCSDMGSAHKIFSNLSVKNSVSFNTMIVGYCDNGDISEAKELFDQMDRVGFKKDIISWNSMISGCVNNFLFNEAFSMFHDLLTKEGIEPDSFTLGSVLTACADMASLKQGKQIHSLAIVRGLQSNPFVGGALVEMYCKCDDLVAAQMAFDEVISRDTPTWNTLISNYARSNQIEKIQNLLREMKEDGFEPNVYTWNGILAGYVENGHHESALQLFSNINTRDIYTVGIVLTACSRLARIERGKQIHAHSIRRAYESDVHIGAALVDMYAKCGSIKHAKMTHNQISNPNLISQNSLLTAYAMHGHGEEGIAMFRRMLDNGTKPNNVTFLSVLSSCVHIGSVETGRELFHLMGCYNLTPTLKHYTCMVDLLSRAGKLDEAYELVKNMPMEPDSVVWGALLGGCVNHGNVELGEIAAERLIELDPNSTGNYVLFANLYAYAGRWSDLARIRQMMNDEGMQKNPGCSWIEDRDEIHVFLVCDRSHKRTGEIYATLDTLTLQMRAFKDVFV